MDLFVAKKNVEPKSFETNTLPHHDQAVPPHYGNNQRKPLQSLDPELFPAGSELQDSSYA